MPYNTDTNVSCVPQNVIALGNQNDSGIYYSCVVISDRGLIPGKAKTNEAWYGRTDERSVNKGFYWITIPVGYEAKLEKKPGSPPIGALKTGYEVESSGNWYDLYSGVAHTGFGDIPAKVYHTGVCRYTYAGKECQTPNFSWVVIRKC